MAASNAALSAALWRVFPGLPRGAPPGADGAPGLDDGLRNFKRRMLPAEGGARAGDLVAAERGAVDAGGAGLVRRAEPDDGAAADQARPVLFGAGLGNRGGDGVHVVPVDGENLPSVGFEARRGVVGHGEVGAAVN